LNAITDVDGYILKP